MAEGLDSRRRVEATPASSRFRPDIQGLRAIAVLAVVLYHADLGLPGGFVGVDVFLVVSGFVITGMLVNEHDRTGRTDLRRFYLRRIRRLLPALATLMVVVLALEPFLGGVGTSDRTTRTALWATVFNANTFLMRLQDGYFDLASNSNPLLHLWTLAVEEQFYLGFPLILIGLWRWRSHRGSRRVPTIGIALLALASFGLNIALVGDPDWSKVAFYSAPTRAWEFLAGAALALWPVDLGRRAATACAVAGAGAFGAALFLFDNDTSFPGTAALLPVAAAVLLVAGGAHPATPVSRFLGHPALRWLGDRSYSWYLWHWPVIVYLHAVAPTRGWTGPVAVVASLALAAGAYRLIEDPIRRRTDRPARATLTVGMACLVLPVVMTQAVVPVRHSIQGRIEPTLGLERHADGAASCVPPDGRRVSWQSCVLPTPGTAGAIMLVGDSNAGHFTEGFIDAAHRLGYDASVDTASSCPFLGLRARRTGEEDPAAQRRCGEAQAGVDRKIARVKPSLIVLSVAVDLYLFNPEYELGSERGGWTTDPAARAALWTAQANATIDRWGASGATVLVIRPVPRFGDWGSQAECARIVVLTAPERCGASAPTDRLLADRRSTVAVLDGVVRSTGAASFDPVATLCPGDRCSTYRDGHWWWRDAGHISVYASRALATPLADAFARALA